MSKDDKESLISKFIIIVDLPLHILVNNMDLINSI